MRTIAKAALAAALMAPLTAAPAESQNYKWDLGVNGGYSWYRSMLDADNTGATGVENDDVKFEAGWLTGAQVGLWATPRFGLRLNATFAERPVVTSNYDLLDPNEESTDIFDDVNLWSGSADLMFRLRAPNSDWMGAETLPYLALGVGAKWVNPAGDAYTCVDGTEGEEWACQPFQVRSGTTLGNGFALGEQRVLMGLVGLGADFRLSPNFAIRAEVNDRIYRPQIYEADVMVGTDGRIALTNGDENISKLVHEVGAQIGLHLLAGLDRREVVAVVPAPAPPAPAPSPQPAPAPEPPAETMIRVCVVDPTAANGLRMQDAFYVVGTPDTMVVVNGQRMPLRTAVGNVMVARNAEWYVRGQPLTLQFASDRMEFLTYQGAVNIEADRLAYLGTISGYPVYAEREVAADLAADMAELRAAQASNDLADILDERRDIRGELDDLEYIYIPLDATGCVFQPLRLMEQVRKSGEN